MQFGWEIFTLSPVVYIRGDFTKMVRDLFHAGSTLVESNVSREKQGYWNCPET